MIVSPAAPGKKNVCAAEGQQHFTQPDPAAYYHRKYAENRIE
jgi:hypothetical protein